MKKLLLTLALLSFANSAMANTDKVSITLTETCFSGVAYWTYYSNGYLAITPKLLPSGKPAACNY